MKIIKDSPLKKIPEITNFPSKFELQSLEEANFAGVENRKVNFALPRDQFSPAMHTSPERLKPGSRLLKRGWTMCASEEMPAKYPAEAKTTSVPSQWAVEEPEYFSHNGNVWYKKNFMVRPDEIGPDKHVDLKFNGVDYEAEVYLNGEKLGEHEGYFTPFKFSLDDKVTPGKFNTLLVKVSGGNDGSHPFFKKQVKGIFTHHDCRPGGSNPFGKSEALGSSGGIWNDVLLESTGRETIENQYVDTLKLTPDHKRADLSFNYTLHNHDSEAKKVLLKVSYAPMEETDPKKFKELTQEVELKPGENQVSLETPENDPQLWWTHDLGKPQLYQTNTSVVKDGKVSDSIKGHFGIRTLEEKMGNLKLNHQPIYQKGSNYIATEWLSTYNEDKYTDDLNQMKEANLNAVRVHAHVLPQEFYDAADKEGMLVWADFPLHWGVSPTPSVTRENKKQFTEFVQLYRNHPSIWTWSAHNEPLPYSLVNDHLLSRQAEKLMLLTKYWC